MTTDVLERRRLAIRRASLTLPGPEALAAAAVTVAFMIVSFIWLARDQTVPIFDNGVHLTWATHYRDMIASGDLLRPFETWIRYPPLVHLVGAAGMFIGGKEVAPAVTAQNVVFVPLLALGCYQAGRIAFNRLAGALAATALLVTYRSYLALVQSGVQPFAQGRYLLQAIVVVGAAVALAARGLGERWDQLPPRPSLRRCSPSTSSR